MCYFCKKDSNKKCWCLKRKHGDCADCEKRAIKIVHDSGRNLNETVKVAKETGETIHDLYVTVDGFTGESNSFSWRSAIDILRGVCDYCEHNNSHTCDNCMWSNETDGEDLWTFDERLLKSII